MSSMMFEAPKVVRAIKFGVFLPTEIRKYSVVEITIPETYDEDGLPIPGGLMDNRLGVLEPGQVCGTCGNPAPECPGHFGHIELAEPVVHASFADDIKQLLTVTCRSCGRLLIPEAEIEAYRKELEENAPYKPDLGEKIAKEIYAKARKAKICPHCGAKKLEVEFTRPHIFHEIMEDGSAVRLTPAVIRERLEKITDDDYRLLGYDPSSARPEWFVLQVLPVPPVSMRPSITLESGVRSEDDLTHKLVDIVRTNARVKEAKESGSPPLIMQDLMDLLQYHVTTYFDNEASSIPPAHHRSGRPLKTLSQRLKGKEGRFRGSLSGKRVDFSARTVISPDPSMDISEVGVPVEVAKKLTVPERVTPWNIEFLRELVRNGPGKYPGANYIVRPDGVKIRLEFVPDRDAYASSLEVGYVVERHLMNGDVVLFNRQPSLHRMSIMAHYVRVLPYRTFRLHPAVCPPYNADFDGDEMNLHVPQGEEARSEAHELMSVQGQIISPRYGGPIIGAIRDYLSAGYLLTKDDTLLDPQTFAYLAYEGGYTGPLPEPAVRDPTPMYSGKQLFSLFLPRGFNYVLTSRWAKSMRKRRDVVIRDGQLVSGIIDKASIGAEEPDSLLHRIVKDYGNEEARRFLNSVLKVLKEYITDRGFSYGYDDLEIPADVKAQIKEAVDDAYRKIQQYVDDYMNGRMTPVRGLRLEDVLEQKIMDALGEARDRAGELLERVLPSNNPGVIMSRTGARGSSLNLGQMMALLGQQAVRGKRIKRGYRHRPLPHFKEGEPSPDAYGFVKSSFRDGLTPIEFFYHSMAGREGLVDTAVRTQQSGYMQRRLVNAMEHLRVEYDYTVRDPEGNIIQFTYGEDGIDPAKSDHGEAVNLDRLADTIMLNDDPSEPRATPDEKASILSKYEGDLNDHVRDKLRSVLMSREMSVKSAEAICSRAIQMIDAAKIEPGEAAGIVSAQSIGEPGTQMTLRTFHFAGVKEKDVTLGLPRLIELVDARKQPSTPVMEIYLDEEHRRDRDKALEVAREILFTRVGDIASSVEIDYSTGSVVISLNRGLLEDRGCTVEEVAKALSVGKRKVEYDSDSATISVSLESFDITSLYSLRDKVLRTRVKGIAGINRVSLEERDGEWVIVTSGSDLRKVFQIPGVDPTRTRTNSINEIAMVLGIEAARQALIEEMLSTLEEQGLEVDVRHIMLVADLMTHKGIVQQVGRHGVAGTKASILARAAFEITVPTLAEAAAKGETDELRGVTENVIVGGIIPVGTGMVDLYMSSAGEGDVQ
ncbi:MAG: DNA-directed RNA polymerase subunit A' [Conexivisphaerales archaeon]|jgi:DNA-directed RNA polymerase subunit A'|nr:DNA-directed RNA polymerase subunit A' [Conexivisphaerales archaeon]